MMKKMEKRSTPSQVLMGILLVALLGLGLPAPLFAAEDDISVGTEQNPARMAITKALVMPGETVTPTATFTFRFTKKSVDGNNAPEALATMPEPNDLNIVFSTSDTGSLSNGVKTVYKESGTIQTDDPWPHAGVFIYSVTELPDTYAINDAFSEQISYSQGSYDVAVYVQEGGDGLYISAIAVTIGIEDHSNAGSDPGDKVDATPGGNPEVPDDFSKMVFTNEYLKNNGGTDPTDTVLEISKRVAGDFANKTKHFLFEVTVDGPTSHIATATTYKAYVLDENDAVVTSAANAAQSVIKTDSADHDYIEFTADTTLEVYLKHGQKLSFVDLPVGSRYVVNEAATVGYKPDYILTRNGSAGNKVEGAKNTPLCIGETYLSDNTDVVAFTNTNVDVSPTGIDIDNLPYLVPVGIGVVGLIFFAVLKGRKYGRGNSGRK